MDAREGARRAGGDLDPRKLLAERPGAAIVAGCGALAALSLLLPSTPTYDPWAWIIWGREVASLELDTRFGPSWKPLPVLFTTPLSLFGDAAPELWLVVARAGGLLGLVAAYRLAARLAGVVAGAAAVAAIGLAPWFVRNVWLGNSEGLLVGCALWAVERHLAGERRQALWLLLGAALLRPEAWPFLGFYGLWLWRAAERPGATRMRAGGRERGRRVRAGERERGTRVRVAAALAAVPLLWLGPEAWGSGDPLRAGERAQTDLTPQHAGAAERPALEIVDLFQKLLTLPVKLGLAAAALALALRWWGGRRRALAGWLGGAALAWVAIVAVMAEAGYSGNQRYLLLPAAAGAVLAAAGAAELARRVARALAGRALSPRARFAVLTRPGRWLAFERRTRRVALAASTAAAFALFAAPDAGDLRPLARSLDYQAELTADLDAAVDAAGGRERLLACGPPVTGPYLVPAVAWRLRVHSREVRLESAPPAVFFRARDVRGRAPRPAVHARAVPLAQAGEWRVLAACDAAASAPPGATRAGYPRAR